jgi:hypothetical protein
MKLPTCLKRQLLKRLLTANKIKLFGQNFSSPIKPEGEMEQLKQKTQEILQQMQVMRGAIIEIHENSGGQGWTQAMQNAIHGLDKKIEMLWNTAQEHHSTLEDLKGSREQFWSQSLGLESQDN